MTKKIEVKEKPLKVIADEFQECILFSLGIVDVSKKVCLDKLDNGENGENGDTDYMGLVVLFDNAKKKLDSYLETQADLKSIAEREADRP